MDKNKLAFTRKNFILLGIGMAVVVLGFILMAGPGSTETHFDPAQSANVTWYVVALTLGAVFVAGICLTLICASFSVNRYLSRSETELYRM